MKKKLLSLLLTGTMVAAMLAGCGGSGNDSAATNAPADTGAASTDNTAASADNAAASTDNAAAGGDETLTVWCWDPAFNLNAMYEAEKVYQKDHPNFKLNVVETPWEDIQTKITTAATSNDLRDRKSVV